MNASYLIETTFAKIQASKASKKEKENMMFAVDLNLMAYAHLTVVAFTIFMQKLTSSDFKCQNLKTHTHNCGALYALEYLRHNSAGLYDCGYFKNGSSKQIDEAFKLLLTKLRPQILNLSEIFQAPDEVLMSACGNSYGDIYETHLEWAKTSRLNDDKGSIPKGWDEYIMPILRGKL